MARPRKSKIVRREGLSITVPASLKRLSIASGNASEFFEYAGRMVVKELIKNPKSLHEFMREIMVENALAGVDNDDYDNVFELIKNTLKIAG